MQYPANKDEELFTPPRHILDSINPKRLELIILPTEKCNFRCTYCYEDFEIGRMKPDVVNGIKALITKRAADLRVLELSWFGGEPLLATKEIFDICNHANMQAKLNPDMRVISGMTTNGALLTPGLAARLDEAGVKQYQISLDGPRDLHNTTRIDIKGRGTYDTIWENLVSLSKTSIKFRISLRVHYQFSTWEDVLPLVDSIKDNFGGDARFNTFFKPIVALGGKNDAAIVRLSQSQKREIQRTLQQRLSGQQEMAEAAQSESSSERTGGEVCYAAQANSLVIRANGAINKCTVALSDDRNEIGRINQDGTLTIDREKMTPWLRGIETQKAFELSCPYASHMSQWPRTPSASMRMIPIAVA